MLLLIIIVYCENVMSSCVAARIWEVRLETRGTAINPAMEEDGESYVERRYIAGLRRVP